MTEIITGVGSPGTINSASGGRVYAYNIISSSPLQVVGQNASRQSITFHNPGSVDIFVAPTMVQNSGSDVALSPTPSNLGGCLRVPANGGTLVITGECQKPWQAFSASGSGNPLTVVDTNV